MTIDNQTLDSLTEQAKLSPRLRMNLNFHESLDEKCHRFLNALEPGTVLPIHRHTKTTEVVVILRGKAVQYLYDDKDNETGQVLLEAGGECPGMSIERGQWHRIESLESGTVIFEAKDGPYHPLEEDEVMVK